MAVYGRRQAVLDVLHHLVFDMDRPVPTRQDVLVAALYAAPRGEASVAAKVILTNMNQGTTVLDLMEQIEVAS